MDLTGVYVPVVTPFDASGRVDVAQLDRVLAALLAAGVHGIVACGTTGEAYALSLEERRAVTARVKEVVDGQVPILGGVGGMSTDQAIDHALLAKALELDGLMLAAPAYCLPTPGELTAHVRSVVTAAGLPTVLYDYPQRTGVSFGFDVLDELADNPLILGVKEASGDLDRLPVFQERYAGRLQIVCGADADAPTFLDAGSRCWIGGIANLLPAAHVAMLDPGSRPQVLAAIAPVLRYVESGRYITKIKAGMGLRGVDVGLPRRPLSPLEASSTSELAALLDAAGPWAPSLTQI